MLRTKAVRRVWQMSRPVGTCILVCAIVAFRFIHLYAYMHVYIRHLTFYFSIYIYIYHIGPGSEDRRKFQRLPMSVVSRASGCKGSIFGVIGVRVMFLEATDDRAADGQLVSWSCLFLTTQLVLLQREKRISVATNHTQMEPRSGMGSAFSNFSASSWLQKLKQAG